MAAHSPQDVYARHLASPRGYPLWTPEPNMNLPYTYVQEGLKIGDVGVVREDGSFDVFFNICLPHTHSLHRRGVPNNFTPISPEELDIAKYLEAESAGRIISTSSMVRVRDGDAPDENPERPPQPGPLNYKFTLSSQEGAVLILPEGAECYYLLNECLFRDRAARHALGWYNFAEQRLGRIISHDSLYLITGFYKARSWSLAAYQQRAGAGDFGEASAQFKAVQVGRGNITTNYTWETTHAMDWRVGPSDQYHHGFANQSVFIQGFKIAVREGILGKRTTVKADFPSIRAHHVSHPRNLQFLRLWGGGTRSGGGSGSGAQASRGPVSSLGAETSDDGLSEVDHDVDGGKDENIIIERFPHVAKTFHPCDIINQYLLKEVPSASVAVTHDKQWISLLDKELLDISELSQPNRLIGAVRRNYSTALTGEDVVYLRTISMGIDKGQEMMSAPLPFAIDAQHTIPVLAEPSRVLTAVEDYADSERSPALDGLATTQSAMKVTPNPSSISPSKATVRSGSNPLRIEKSGTRDSMHKDTYLLDSDHPPQRFKDEILSTQYSSYSKFHASRHIIFIGEIRTGKSSVINLLLQSGTDGAPVSNDSRPCTQTSQKYETTINGTHHFLWDTRGLGEAHSWYQYLFGGDSEKELKTFLKERHRNHEIDLVVYCVRGVRATTAFVKFYEKICAITRRLAAPVAIVVTGLEREPNMEDWWAENSSEIRELGMVFDGHACITALPGHPRRVESRRRLADLITKDYYWAAKESGSYFGSSVQKSAPTLVPPKGGMAKLTCIPEEGTSFDEEGLSRFSGNQSSTLSAAPSQTGLSYYTANSPTASSLSSPAEPPTPRAATTPVRVPPYDIYTHLLGSNHPPSLSSDGTLSTQSSSSMFHSSPHSSSTSHSAVIMEPPSEEKEDYYFSELPFKQSDATIRRRSPYPTRNGAFGDIWECDLVSGESSRIVAVKAIRTNTSGSLSDDLRCHKKLRRELKVWGKLRHRNIVPLLGMVSDFGRLPSLVTPWFNNGSLSHYMARHQLSMPDKHRLLWDIAVGLSYLHSQNIVHGDLHSANVLIDDDGTACIADFDLSFIRDSMDASYLKAGGICGLIHFADPAVVKIAYFSESQPQEEFRPTKPGDIYSYGGIMLHILSGKKPFEGIAQHRLISMILEGERPKIPIHDHITRSHKKSIEMCWHPEEHERPSADDLVRIFGRA